MQEKIIRVEGCNCDKLDTYLKEGWIIKPKDYQIYQSKEDAEEVCNKNYQVIAKIIWEE